MAETVIPAAGKDVAEPGTTPPPSTSKPVIVGHSGQLASDPMMTETANPEQTKAPTILAPAAIPPSGSSHSKLTPSAGAQDAQAEAVKANNAASDADDAEQKAHEAHDAHLQELIESGEYRVSISQKQAKNSATTFIVTVCAIVLVGIIILFMLTDLKVIDLGIKLPFHIFKQ